MRRSLEKARIAKEKLRALLGTHGSVIGIGIAQATDGYCLKVNLDAGAHERPDIPTSVDGVPVVAEVVGKISKRSR